jgi:mannose-6-phosphate isomerase-like protein (cupin superfamily)
VARHIPRDGADGLKEADMNQPQAVKDASHLYEVERRALHAVRPGFRISELQLSATQKVPWHTHSNISDTFYILEGEMRLFLQDPKEEVNLRPGEVYVVKPKRPHLVVNGGTTSLTFLILQGVGEYDFVPLVPRQAASA